MASGFLSWSALPWRSGGSSGTFGGWEIFEMFHIGGKYEMTATTEYWARRHRVRGWFNLAGLLFIWFVPLLMPCHAADGLPNLKLTPGVADPRYTDTDQICNVKWGKDARHVTAAMKKQVFVSYGYPKLNKDPRCPCEIDHLISRELGGMDDVGNLWPQSYRGPRNAHDKDKLENRLHKEMCAGSITLEEIQVGIVKDWTELYDRYYPKEVRKDNR